MKRSKNLVATTETVIELNKKSVVLQCYEKFEHLAEHYAGELYDLHKISFEREDVVQELKMKIYTCILSYADKWRKWKESGRYKPVPLDIYIKTSLINRIKDFIKVINEVPIQSVSVQDNNFDYAIVNSIESRMQFDKDNCVCEINGVNLFTNLSLQQSRCFMLYLRGYGLGTLNKMFRRQFSASEVVMKQIDYIKEYRDELTNHSHQIVKFSQPEE